MNAFQRQIDISEKLVNLMSMDMKAREREWVGLTDKEIETIVNNNTYDETGVHLWCHGKGIARDIEATLKEKNT